jgi:uncharacterized protein
MKQLWMMFACFVLMVSAHAASFDCAKAASRIEKLICSDAELSKLDEELSTAYKAALEDVKQAVLLKQWQRQWLKERNGCSDVDCVKQVYEVRLFTLQHIANTTSPSTSAGGASVNKSKAHYVLMMSEDNSVCKPILAEYNRNSELDLPRLTPPHLYPWPAPPTLTVNWKVKPWNKSIPENERSLLERMYSYIEADVNGDGETETVVRWAAWLRVDDRFSSLGIFPYGTVLSDEVGKYRSQANVTTNVSGGDGYHFPKLKGRTQSATLNDFDLIQFKSKYYVTGKSVDLDGVIEIRATPQWRVISRVRFVKPSTEPRLDLDRVLDSVCYFKMKITK